MTSRRSTGSNSASPEQLRQPKKAMSNPAFERDVVSLNDRRFTMHDSKKIEGAVLAWLGAFAFDNGHVWKRFDSDVMQPLSDRPFCT